MTTTNQYLALLAPGGHMREFMRAAPQGGPWVDDFCEGLIHRLSLQSELEKCPKDKVHTWLLDAPAWQVNINAARSEGWNVTHTGDLLADLVSALKRQRKIRGE